MYNNNFTMETHVNGLLSISNSMPEQKSKEWIDMKLKMIGASEIGSILGINPYQTYEQLLHNKRLQYHKGIRTFQGNEATLWGEKYEPIAQLMYEYLNNCQLIELNFIPDTKVHQVGGLEFLGISPDGLVIHRDKDGKIVDLNLVEIKCPFRRPVKPNYIPAYYKPQMYAQMYVTEVYKCDFLDVKLSETDSIDLLNFQADEDLCGAIFHNPKNGEQKDRSELRVWDYFYPTEDIIKLWKKEITIYDLVSKHLENYNDVSYFCIERYSIVRKEFDPIKFESIYDKLIECYNDIIKII